MKSTYIASAWAILPDYQPLIAGLYSWTEDEIAAKVREMAAASSSRRPAPARPGIALVPVHGVMEHRAGLFTAFGFGVSTSDLRALIRQLGDDPDVKAVVLDIDSPGGEVEGVTEAAAEIRAVRERKPVIASANSMAASAAYWLGSQASEFVAPPSGQVGSIGVYGSYADVSGALEQAGIQIEVVSAGKFKTEAIGLGPLTEEARAHKQSLVDGYYEMFVSDVAQGRGTTSDVVRDGFGEGRVLLARDAQEAGMIDRVETLDATVGRVMGAPSPLRAEAEAERFQAELAIRQRRAARNT